MPAYETKLFEPPAPIAQVTVRSPRTDGSVADVTMLIDTGADVTLLPRTHIVSLLGGAQEGEAYELVGFDGARSFADSVRLELYFLGRVFRGQFLLIDQDHGILGRNILNAIPLLLDGPKLQWDEHQ